jgi:hypothetical protein
VISDERARRIAARWVPLSAPDSQIARLGGDGDMADPSLLETQLEACYRAHQWDSPHNTLVELVALIDWSRLRAPAGVPSTPEEGDRA